MFEFADVWTDSVERMDYVRFLSVLLDRISFKKRSAEWECVPPTFFVIVCFSPFVRSCVCYTGPRFCKLRRQHAKDTNISSRRYELTKESARKVVSPNEEMENMSGYIPERCERHEWSESCCESERGDDGMKERKPWRRMNE